MLLRNMKSTNRKFYCYTSTIVHCLSWFWANSGEVKQMLSTDIFCHDLGQFSISEGWVLFGSCLIQC